MYYMIPQQEMNGKIATDWIELGRVGIPEDA